MKSKKNVFFLGIVISATLCFWQDCAGIEDSPASYICRGNYEFQVNPYDTNVPAWSNMGTFEVLVNVCQWRITLHPQPVRGKKGRYVSYKQFEAVFDGDSIYEYTSTDFPTNFDASKTYATGQLVRGPVPQRLDPRIRHIWLGLASGCYFQENAQGYLPRLALPPEDTSKYDGFRLQNVNWGYLGARVYPKIPDWIVYGGAERYAPTGQITEGDPYANQTNILMTVFSHTNIGNISLPASVKVVEFHGQKPIQSTSYVVTSVENEKMAMAVNRPELTTRTIFIERRLTNQATFAQITFTMSNWPSINQSERMFTLFSKAPGSASLASQSKARLSVGLGRYLLVVAVIGPLLFLWLYQSYKLRSKS